MVAFALALPLFTRPAQTSLNKCRHRTSASATASPSPIATSAASDNATPSATAANGGASSIVPETTSSTATVESIELDAVLFDLGRVTSLADVSEITQLADDFDLADLRIESGGVTVEITRDGGRGFVDGVLRELPAPVIQSATTTTTNAIAAADEVDSFYDPEPVIDVDELPVSKSSQTEAPPSTDPNTVYDSDFIVKSNRVGFFFSGARNKPPLVNVGDHVAFNQPVCIIEQLGQQYVYLSEVSGTVTKIFVEDGDAVMFDDEVMVIRPD